MSIKISADIIGKLREAVIGMEKSAIYKDIVEPQDAVFARFQPVFAKKNVQKISEEEFRSFLLLENNHHWTGLQRHGPRMCADIVKLRKALSILVNEELELMSRLDKSIDMVSGLGKNLATAILLVIQPEKHGVWNSRSEENLKRLDIWPNFEHGESFGSRYM